MSGGTDGKRVKAWIIDAYREYEREHPGLLDAVE